MLPRHQNILAFDLVHKSLKPGFYFLHFLLGKSTHDSFHLKTIYKVYKSMDAF